MLKILNGSDAGKVFLDFSKSLILILSFFPETPQLPMPA
jgi:hypothetical protein